jgi:group I intron endonuclease
MNIKTGIYKILNKISNNFYIGSSSSNLSGRWSTHKYYLKKGKHHSQPLQRAYNKYGLDVLEFIIIEECEPEKCIEREQYYIDLYDPEYNCCKIAGSTRGLKTTENQKEIARRVHKNNTYVKGRKMTKEEVIRRQNSRRLSGKNKPMLGKTHSEETKRKMSEKRKGVKKPHVAERVRVEVYCENNGKSYKSINDAIVDILETYGKILHNPNVSNVVNGKAKHTKGFRFKRLEKGTVV